MTEDNLDIETDKYIDPDALDVEWLNQTNLYYKYSEALNKAIDERNEQKVTVDEKKDNLEVLKSELDLEIRNNPKDFDLEKITDTSVKAALLADDRYQKSLDDYYETRKRLNESQAKVNKLYTDVNTISEKKISLQEIGRLLAQQYFCAPTVPRDLSQEWQKKQNNRDAKEKVKRAKRSRSR